ncbi:MAG: endo-1,4-beta-xylanase [Bacteroidota bacterium]|nr:endo-1,4-beta-xylanase [Bacteroidota bacterium]
MKLIKTLQTLFFLVLVSPCLMAQIPDGGSSLISTTATNYQKIGNYTLTAINIENQTFTKGLRFTTGATMNNSWDAQIKFTSAAGIAKDDVVLVAFYARTTATLQEFGVGALTVCIENNTSYAKEIYYKVNIGTEWKQYYASVKCANTLAASAVSYSFHIGYPNQTVEIADAKFLNYKNTLTLAQLPITEVTYFGREADAAWRAPADERINQIRKGIVDMVVYDEQGQVVKDASVSIEMTRHKFGFGSAVAANTFLNNTTYREKVYELFNEVVFENDLKWGSFNPNSTFNIRRSLDSLDKKKIEVRGHNVIWPSFKYIPSAVASLKSNPTALRNEIEKRIDDVSKFASGRLNDWDVLNEPYSEKEVQAILGDEVMADWFKRVRANDRKVKLYINDYNILSAGGNDVKHQDGYFNIIKYIDEKGGKIEGIGLQGHFNTDLTPIAKVYTILERFATLGKEIKITEHDINITQRAVQSDYTRDFITICFSHPSVKSFLTWGFWAGQHWLPDGAYYASDWTIRPHGEVYKDLVFNQWWTKKTDKTTDSEGKVSFEGFLGTYKYTIKSGGKERTGTFSIDHSKQSGAANSVTLSFDTSIPDNVSITTTKPTCLCEGETIFLNAPAGNGLTYQWFRGTEVLPETSGSIAVKLAGMYSVKVKKGTVAVSSAPLEVIVNPMPKAEITPTGDLSFCPGGKVKLSANTSNNLTYTWMKGTTKIQGSVTSIDATETGSYRLITNSNGCATYSEPVAVQVYSAISPECTTGLDQLTNAIRVYPNPFSGTFVLETNFLGSDQATAELFNSVGSKIYSRELVATSGKTTIEVPAKGFYTLRVSNKKEVRIFKMTNN